VVRPTAGDARDQAGRNVRGKKWGEERCMYGGKNGLLRAGWEKEKRGKEKKNKRKSWPAARGWLGEKENREREREKKKKRPAASYLAGWEKEKEREKKKKKPRCVRGWMHGEEKKLYIAGRPAGEGKKIYCRPGKKNNKKKKQEDSETCGWNSKFENMAGENVMEFYFF
jgi:hypothetical protein